MPTSSIPEVCASVCCRPMKHWLLLLILMVPAAAWAQMPEYSNSFDASRGLRDSQPGVNPFVNFDSRAVQASREGRTISTDFLRHPLTPRLASKLMVVRGLGEKGNHQEAIAALERILAERPSSAPFVHNLLGIEHVELGHYAEAKASFQKVIEYMPHTSANYSNYGLALAQAGDIDDAEVALQKALTLDKHNRIARDILNMIENAKQQARALARR
jgi:Flp pilus assembly protein TadD